MRRKRLSIPMDIKTYNALKRLGKATNASIGATAASYLDQLEPQFSQLAEAFELIKSDPDKGIKLLQKAGFEAQKKLTEEQLGLLDSTDEK